MNLIKNNEAKQFTDVTAMKVCNIYVASDCCIDLFTQRMVHAAEVSLLCHGFYSIEL